MPIINNFPSGGSSSANIVYGTYTGNSTENNGQQIINLGFTPLMLIVIDEEYQFTTIAVNDGKKSLGTNTGTNISTGSYVGFIGAIEKHGYVTIIENGFIAQNGSEKSWLAGYNYDGQVYKYIAFV